MGGKKVWKLLQALFSVRNGMKGEDDSIQQKELFLSSFK